MTTKAQAESNKKNARKSTGPTSEAGKSRSRLNGLVHGLRSEAVVIPGEDPAEFEAERQAWFDELRPESRARAALVERAVVAAWRCRRCVRIEAARLDQIASRVIGDDHAAAARRVDDAEALLKTHPRRALKCLEAERDGVVRLIRLWSDLAVAAATEFGWMDGEDTHGRLIRLLGCSIRDRAEDAGPAAVASCRLLLQPIPGSAEIENPFGPMDECEAGQVLRTLQGGIARKVAELTASLARFADPGEQDRLTALAGSVDTSDEGKLLHRYEMAHDRSLRASIAALIQLDRSGIDLHEPDDDTVEDAEAPSEPIGQKSFEEDPLQTAPGLSTGTSPLATGPPLPSRTEGGRDFMVEGTFEGGPAVFRVGLLDLSHR